jgi:hypothetical protein
MSTTFPLTFPFSNPRRHRGAQAYLPRMLVIAFRYIPMEPFVSARGIPICALTI